MAKVLLVKPRFSSFEFQSVTHPMGLMYLASSLMAAGHSVQIHDCLADDDLQILTERLKQFPPDYVGISVIVSEQTRTRLVVEAVRRVLPDVPIIVGGPCPSADPEEVLLATGANYAVVGEGEHTIVNLLIALETNGVPLSVPGVGGFSDDRFIQTPGNTLSTEDLDLLPLPAWELLDLDLYNRRLSIAGVGPRPYMSVVTSRGCPFHCAYCHHTMGKNFRPRSAESVLEELSILKNKFGFKEFEIIDDCFNLDRERMRSILAGIRSEIGVVKLHFPNGVRSDRLEPDDMRIFKEAGTVSCCFAIETASPRLQKLVHKNLNIDRSINTIRAAVEQGIYSTGLFMLGFPTETYEEAMMTIELAAKLPLHRAYFMLVTPFPGTELAEMAAETLDRLKGSVDLASMNYLTNTINISTMSDSELKSLFRLSYRHFYMNPLRIVRLLTRHPHKLSLPYYGMITLVKMFRSETGGWRRRSKSQVCQPCHPSGG